MENIENTKNDFSKGNVMSNIIKLALPMTLAQLVNVLYNIVDRIYIGRMGANATDALTGLGVCLPVITIVMAFANFIGMGGAPLFSIERGRSNIEEAEAILGNSFSLLLCFGAILTVVGLIIKVPVLKLLGASDTTLEYADSYITIYLLGNVFVMLSLGLNSFINAQGFGKTGMLTVVIGACINLVLDPAFIFGLHMGVRGAAWATIISQGVAFVWTISFLRGKKTIIRLKWSRMKWRRQRVINILKLGMSGFIMALTSSLVQMTCNANLQIYGGDIYIGVMTIINSIREVVQMPVMGLTNSAQPIISFNYGAKAYTRIKEAIRYVSAIVIVYTLVMWGMISLWPQFFISIFSKDKNLMVVGIPCIHIYFFGFFMMALQFSGQSIFTALGRYKQAIFFSIFRKVIIVVPLIFLLPQIKGLGVMGVFLAEPISNFIGGMACFMTMFYTVYKRL